MATPIYTYTVPPSTYYDSPAKYNRVITITNAMLPFYCTGSNAGVLGISCNDNSSTVTINLVNDGGGITLTDLAANVMYDFGVSYISGSLGANKHIHLFYNQ